MNPANMFADTDLGTLIYIIIVFLWVVGNVLGKSKKKQRRGTPIPRAGESSAESELREFIEQLAGKPAEPEPAPASAPPAPPRNTRKRDQQRSRPQPMIFAPPVRAVAPAKEDVFDLEEVARELRDGAPSMAGSFSTTLSSMASLFKTSGITMPAWRYALSSSRPRPAHPVIARTSLDNRNELRRIMVGRILLGAPRALEPYRAETEVTRQN